MSGYIDYSWTEEGSYLYDYCLALIGGGSAHGVLDALGAHKERIVVRGMKTAIREGYDLGEAHGVNGVEVNGVELQLAAVTDLGGEWTLMVQMPGFICVSDTAMAPLTSSYEVVSHDSGRFMWWSEGQRQISFDSLMPYTDLLGVLADRNPAEGRRRILDLMSEVGGFHLEPDGENQSHHVPASFALAERLTGVHLTKELLRELDFIVAVVPLDAATDIDPDLVVGEVMRSRSDDQTDAIRNWAASQGFSVERQNSQAPTDTDGLEG